MSTASSSTAYTELARGVGVVVRLRGAQLRDRVRHEQPCRTQRARYCPTSADWQCARSPAVFNPATARMSGSRTRRPDRALKRPQESPAVGALLIFAKLATISRQLQVVNPAANLPRFPPRNRWDDNQGQSRLDLAGTGCSHIARLEAGSFVTDLVRRDVLHHGEKLMWDQHRRAGLVAVDENTKAPGLPSTSARTALSP